MGILLKSGGTGFKVFFIHFAVLFWAFTQFYYMSYGADRVEYSTAIKTLEGLFAVFLGGGSTFKVGSAIGDDILGRVMMYLFGILLIFTVNNMFIAMLGDLYHYAVEKAEEEAKQLFDPIDFIMERFTAITNILTQQMKSFKAVKFLVVTEKQEEEKEQLDQYHQNIDVDKML